MTGYFLKNVRPWGGPAVDLRIESSALVSVASHDPDRIASADDIDGRGLLAIPGLINAHAHVDKSWWGKPWQSYAGETSTVGRIAHERVHRDALGIPGVEATTAVLREFLRHGTTAIRTHVDVDLGVGLRGIEVVREAVSRLGGLIDVEIVAFPRMACTGDPGCSRCWSRRPPPACSISAAWILPRSTAIRWSNWTACSTSHSGTTSESTSPA